MSVQRLHNSEARVSIGNSWRRNYLRPLPHPEPGSVNCFRIFFHLLASYSNYVSCTGAVRFIVFYALAVRLLDFATARTPCRWPHARGTLGVRAGWFPALQPSFSGFSFCIPKGRTPTLRTGNTVQEGIPFVASQELFCACTASCARLLRTLTSLSVILRFKVGSKSVQSLQGVVVLRVTPSEGMFGEQSCALPKFSLPH